MSPKTVRSHDATGIIREFSTDGHSVVIRHDEIPGVMPKMTMTLNVRDSNSLNGLREGDEVRFRIHIGADEHWIDSIERTGHQTPKAPASASIRQTGSELTNGQMMPDFEWLAEDRSIRRISDYRGNSVAFTFVFTRCPLPEYCPRMTRNFHDARELLLKNSDGSTRWKLLSLSFDPGFDTPEVLGRYAEASREGVSTGWSFGVLSANTLSNIAPRLDLRIVPDSDGFSHNLRTVVLDATGRIHRQFDGNGWTATELAKTLLEASRSR